MSDLLEELRRRGRLDPFEPFAIIMKDGRRIAVTNPRLFGFNFQYGIVLDEEDRAVRFKPAEIIAIETLHAVS